MSMKTVCWARVRGCLLAGAVASVFVLAAGCSGAAPTDGTDQTKVDESVSPQACINCPPPPLVFPYPPPDCRVLVNGVVQMYAAHYVEKLPNTWGQHYLAWNQRFDDGYSFPFPTPADWPKPASVANYEAALWQVPSTLWWQYVIKELTPPPPGSRIWAESARSFFMVGIPQIGDYARAYSIAQQYPDYPVEAKINTCVHVTVRSGNTLYDTGETFYVYDEHDPYNPPW